MDGVASAPVLAGLGVGIALAGAPGPVQAVLLGESLRGGVARGLRALAGVHVTFGLLLAAVALGLSLATPSGAALRLLRVAGGVLLLWLAADGLRTGAATATAPARRGLPPSARGSLAILLNPGAWLFLGAVAPPLCASAARLAGTGGALLVVAAMVAGAAAGDLGVVLLGGLGARRAGERVGRPLRAGLAVVLAGLGAWLLVTGLLPA